VPVSSVEGTFTQYVQPASSGGGMSKRNAEAVQAGVETKGHTSLRAMKAEGVTRAELQQEHSMQSRPSKVRSDKGNAVDQKA
jgi:hypothetical protein